MWRFVDRRLALGLAFAGSLLAAAPALSQDATHSIPSIREAIDEAAARSAVELPAFASERLAPVAPAPSPNRPASLVPLYVAFGALQLLDAHSTMRALDGGAAEGNPLMKAFAGSRAGLVAIKAAGAAGVVYGTERLVRRNRTAAVLLMIAGNSAMVWVVQHNYRAVR